MTHRPHRLRRWILVVLTMLVPLVLSRENTVLSQFTIAPALACSCAPEVDDPSLVREVPRNFKAIVPLYKLQQEVGQTSSSPKIPPPESIVLDLYDETRAVTIESQRRTLFSPFVEAAELSPVTPPAPGATIALRLTMHDRPPRVLTRYRTTEVVDTTPPIWVAPGAVHLEGSSSDAAFCTGGSRFVAFELRDAPRDDVDPLDQLRVWLWTAPLSKDIDESGVPVDRTFVERTGNGSYRFVVGATQSCVQPALRLPNPGQPSIKVRMRLVDRAGNKGESFDLVLGANGVEMASWSGAPMQLPGAPSAAPPPRRSWGCAGIFLSFPRPVERA